MDWKKNALGYFAKTATWTPGIFDFIVAYGGEGWGKPNESLKAIEEKANAEGIPWFILWDFNVDYYSRNQIDASEEAWYPEADDWPYQMVKRAIGSRMPNGLIVRMMTEGSTINKVEKGSYISFATMKFTERANRHLYSTKGLDKWTFVLTSDPFIKLVGDEEYFYSWLDGQALGIEQMAKLPLDGNAFPQATDKINSYIGNNPTYYFWKFHPSLFLYNGSKEALYKFINFTDPNVEPPNPDTNPDPDLTDVKLRLDDVEVSVEYLLGRIKELEDLFRSFIS